MSNAKNGELLELWGEGAVRVFISHTHKHRALASELKESLSKLGIASFVAHEDITPTKKWRREMKKALKSMDILVALLTEDFKASDWTDQEVGFAVGRDIPTISVSIDISPYGFLSEEQAISGKEEPEMCARRIFMFATGDARLKEKAVDAFILAIDEVVSYSEADNLFANHFEGIETLTKVQEKRLVESYNSNSQVKGAFRYNKSIDVAVQLKKLTGHKYSINEWDKLQRL